MPHSIKCFWNVNVWMKTIIGKILTSSVKFDFINIAYIAVYVSIPSQLTLILFLGENSTDICGGARLQCTKEAESKLKTQMQLWISISDVSLHSKESPLTYFWTGRDIGVR